MPDILRHFNTEEKTQLLSLLRRYSEAEALDRFILWGKARYEYNRYKLPKLLNNIDLVKKLTKDEINT